MVTVEKMGRLRSLCVLFAVVGCSHRNPGNGDDVD